MRASEQDENHADRSSSGDALDGAPPALSLESPLYSNDELFAVGLLSRIKP
jgi:hypothetical protein